MKKLGLNEIREKYLSFFESKEHLRLKSFSLIPQNDKSLLLINSGMAPLKPYFTGQEVAPKKRVTTCQKCIRTGDIENVGKTARHGTFFEMLGNFSFGDYFKEEVIPWAWEFVTQVLEIPVDRLYVSIYEEDDEAFEIWNKKMSIPKERIFRMGKEDNFWEVGIGPCGPCSEIYYDRGEKYGCGKDTCTVGCDCDRYMEFWNLVFTQFNKEDDGSYGNLKNPNIDTGMGLERMAVIMQDVYSIFDVDTIKAIRESVCKIAGTKYETNAKNDESIRVITDHVRSITFMTADGVHPSNEGRGYVLRRLLRRAVRHGKLLGIDTMFLSNICEKVIEISTDAYPELNEKKEYILKVISVEEERFNETLGAGMEILRDYIEKLKSTSQTVMQGTETFKLYDTYGFPIDLTREILEEHNLSLDEKSFMKEMENQRQRARAAREESNYMGHDETIYNKLNIDSETLFTGYTNFVSTDSQILAITSNDEIVTSAKEGDEVSVIVNKTPFYAESGGQSADSGILETQTGKVVVSNCIKISGNKFAHIGKITEGIINTADTAKLLINEKARVATARNHSATHLLQKALRGVLGTHVEQAGSLVNADKLRFDFTHFAPLTADEIIAVENIVNEKILEALPINIDEMSIDEARKLGAMALFGEKYGETVRVVNISDYSIELCGGTHLHNTSEICTFKIISEAGIAAGVRRIEALTGKAAMEYFRRQNEFITKICTLTKTTPDNLFKRVETILSQVKELTKEIDSLKSKLSVNIIDDIFNTKESIKGLDVVLAKVDGLDMESLRELGDKIRDKIKSGIVILASNKDEKVNLLSMATKDATASGVHSGKIIKEIATVVGGGGGGRPDMAQAGGKDASKILEALKKAKEILQEQLK